MAVFVVMNSLRKRHNQFRNVLAICMSIPHLVLLLSLFLIERVWGDSDKIESLREAFSKKSISQNQYLSQLAALKFKIVQSQEKTTASEETESAAIDDEMRRSSMTSTYDSKRLSRLRCGKWESPRHDYLYRSDGSWAMLPIIPNVTHGRWKIEGKTYYDWIPGDAPEKYRYKIILLDEQYFIFTDGKHVQYEKRLN